MIELCKMRGPLRRTCRGSRCRSRSFRSRMRVPAMLLFALAGIMGAANQTHLSPRFQTVYILSMANSLDQNLASHLTSGHVLWVVLQPSSADAVLTDSLDDEFWTWLDHNYPSPADAASGYRGPTYRAGYSASRHRGTIFLVDPRKRVVLWSTYEPAKDSSPASLDRTASRIAGQLRTAF